MPDHDSATLSATASNGEIVVTLKGGPLPKPITHSVPAKDRKAWRELAERFYQEFGIARGDTLNVIQEAVNEAKTKERDSRPAEAPVTKPASAPVETPPERLPTATQSELDGDALPPAPTWQPYPVDTLPRPLSDFVKLAAESMCADPSFVALPLLTACGAAIGLTRMLEAKGGDAENWRVPPILWTAFMCKSGSLKSPSLNFALQWLHAREKTWSKEYKAQRQQYKVNLLAYEKALAEWKRAKDSGEPPEEPKEPMARRILVKDTTVEAIAPILQANPRGLLLARDELAGWIASFDRYTNTRGGDAPFWLSCYNATPHIVDRRTRETIYVPYSAVSITGGIQPGTLQRVFTLALRENGLLARFLLTWPPQRLRIWNEQTVPESVRADVGRVFDRLLNLDFDYDPDGEPCPKIVRLGPQAKAAYECFYNQHNQELIDLTGDLAAAFSKLEEIPLRLGLILHLVRWAAGESVNPNVIDAESMARAITLTEWHKAETARIYDILARGAEGNQQEELVEWIARHGGKVTVRDLTHGLWRFRGKRLEAEEALNELVKAGLGHWEEPPAGQRGGRPKSVFILHHHITTSPKPSKTRLLRGCGDGDVGDAPKNGVDQQDALNPIPPESGGTNSGHSGQPQHPVVDIDELNRRLAEAAEEDAEVWLDY
ncbi:hypothetical protein THTE_3592 [Thermogutta terrifontis]|uniref:DUF3987 domain-containing protein n=1 Tax=Thermogutta terrifontis TaxID=1331910 RepID=A0A286RJQ4_9BACT|nr:YfjI family protein [Thermogutta terrifontis]ASV76193.1 hypothetical protein THTE_3592 [Thermogutta terrifontis]